MALLQTNTPESPLLQPVLAPFLMLTGLKRGFYSIFLFGDENGCLVM